MQTIISSFQALKNLAVVQLSTSDQNTLDYITAEKAISGKLIEVKELNQSGSVNTIFVVNHSEKLVFMMDGDILAGAKQNRVVNTSILLAPHSKTEIPVSCVEAGRWRYSSNSFMPTEYKAPSSLRADKDRQIRMSLKTGRGFTADQGQVWDNVAQMQERHHVQSMTSSLSDVYSQKEKDFETLLKEFAPAEGANGLAIYIGKRLATVDVFNRRDVFVEYFPKILKGAMLEVNFGGKGGKNVPEAEARYRTLEVFDSLEHQEFEERPGVGVGTDRRFESNDLSGFELMLNSQLVHLAAFGGQKISGKGIRGATA